MVLTLFVLFCSATLLKSKCGNYISLYSLIFTAAFLLFRHLPLVLNKGGVTERNSGAASEASEVRQVRLANYFVLVLD